ncbi:ATPase AAA-type core [Penicillium frequentans]|uniref:ATPase AAA-type core n=1 Tax=Penicillium frequentans TaxID=3151616 RepID=A0AAD6GEB2_9EURO|nr:ATPase AAA-type core [Penicillium glabrum]
MVSVQSSLILSSTEHSMALEEISSLYPPSFTTPDTFGNEPKERPPSLKDLIHLVERFLSDLTEPPNTPASEEIYQTGPNAIKLQKLLVRLIEDRQSLAVSEPLHSCSASDEQVTTAPEAGKTETSTLICTTADIPEVQTCEHNMGLKKSCHHDMTPPDSPTKGWASPQATVKDLKHLFDVLGKALSDLKAPPNTPVFHENSQPGPDMIQLGELLKKFNRELPYRSPVICTTPDDFKSFEIWASKTHFKTIFETWDKEACKYKITEPEETSDGLDDYAEYVFVVRERVDRNSEEVTPYIDIKSHGLRDMLREVLHDINAISLMEDKPSIERNVLFHFLPELEVCANKAETNADHKSADVQHLRLLVDHLKHAYASILQRVQSMLQHGQITYDLLWALFKPGCHVYTTCIGTNEPRCVIFNAGEEVTRNDETWFNLECRFIDHDGVKFGKAGIFLRVPKFRGSKPIASLEAYPLLHHLSHEQVRKDLVERGQRFRDFAGSHFQHCEGSAFFMHKSKPIKVNINSRVAVDAAFFHEMQPNYSRPSLRDIAITEKDGIAFFDLGASVIEDREREMEKMRGDGVEPQKLTEADMLITCPTVCCFSFKEKMFLECAVSALRDVNWSPESFDCLQIPPENKTLLLSMAKTRLGLIPTVPFDDVIDGKGQGLNILLDGPPGVGKTFTVEATSEYFKLPLYSISAGELVVDHGDSNALEQQLETIFKIANHFKAVLLLDEADAFMEQRTSYHDAHNRLVTVFLRKLEYYQGILFLTSNRGIQLDDAILSRIHLITKYEGLSKEFRRSLWSTFLAKARTIQGSAVIKERDLRRLEALELNGREIKNIAAIAHALAEANASHVSYKYLELAAKSNQKFSKEFGRERPTGGMYV